VKTNETYKNLLICIIFIYIVFPTSTFASSFSNFNTEEKSFQVFFDNLFNSFFSDIEGNYTNYSKKYYEENDNKYYIENKEINKKDWEKYFKKKHPPKGEIESKHIWKKWYCYDDDWEDWDKKWWDWFH
jgi:hypothetical protein